MELTAGGFLVALLLLGAYLIALPLTAIYLDRRAREESKLRLTSHAVTLGTIVLVVRWFVGIHQRRSDSPLLQTLAYTGVALLAVGVVLLVARAEERARAGVIIPALVLCVAILRYTVF